jgi:hypothetical protein
MGTEDLVGEFLSHPFLHVAKTAVQRITQMLRSGGHTETVARRRRAETVIWET